MRLPLLTIDAAAISAGDTAWVLASTALVMVMTVGLAFFYGGLVRPKNALNTMMMSVVALGLISVQWVLFGYSIAFGHGSPLWGGLAWLGFRGVGVDPDPAYAATIPLQAHAMFQGMFAIITPALISGRSSSGCASAPTWSFSSSGRPSCTTRSPTGCGARVGGSSRAERWISRAARWCTSAPDSRRWSRPVCSGR